MTRTMLLAAAAVTFATAAPAAPKSAPVFVDQHCVTGDCRRAIAPDRRASKPRTARSAKRHAAPAKPGLSRIVAPVSGRVAYVAPSYAARFQAFVTELETAGYRIGHMGGWRRHGSCRGCDMHPRGLALDIDQVGRNRLARGKRLPGGVTAMAARHGLLHGAVWRNPDGGHFEVASGRRPWPIARVQPESPVSSPGEGPATPGNLAQGSPEVSPGYPRRVEVRKTRQRGSARKSRYAVAGPSRAGYGSLAR